VSDYKNISIDVTENGFMVTTNGPQVRKLVFTNNESLREWLRNNLSATGEVERFSEALDDKPEKNNILVDFAKLFDTIQGTGTVLDPQYITKYTSTTS